MAEQRKHRRGRLSKPCDPYPRGQVLTTSPAHSRNAPNGDQPVYVDGRRFDSLVSAGFLEGVVVVTPTDAGEETSPDASVGGPATDDGVTVHVHVDPAPVPPGHPEPVISRAEGEEGAAHE